MSKTLSYTPVSAESALLAQGMLVSAIIIAAIIIPA
jgi:hypothetical protein